MKTAQSHLAEYGVTMQVARDFLINNLEDIGTIFSVCQQYGVTNDMIADILQSDFPGVNGTIVSSFFDNNGFSGASLKTIDIIAGLDAVADLYNIRDMPDIEKLIADLNTGGAYEYTNTPLYVGTYDDGIATEEGVVIANIYNDGEIKGYFANLDKWSERKFEGIIDENDIFISNHTSRLNIGVEGSYSNNIITGEWSYSEPTYGDDILHDGDFSATYVGTLDAAMYYTSLLNTIL